MSLADALFVKSKLGQPAANAPQCDVNVTGGAINVGDTLVAKNLVSSPARKALCP